MIDADECPCILCEDIRNAHCTYEHRSCEKFCHWLNNTAYDVEKVVAELEENSSNYKKSYKVNGKHTHKTIKAISRIKAIGIVRKGGIG